MTVKVGDRLPDGTLKKITAEGPEEVSIADYFGGAKVALFAVPGAFTPTCHGNHLPGYVEHAGDLKSKGVDKIACLAVNDHHVLKVWSKASNAEGAIDFLADGNADYVKALGLDRDLSKGGLGVRAARFSMIVDDGVVKSLNVEEAPGKVEVSGATSLLEAL